MEAIHFALGIMGRFPICIGLACNFLGNVKACKVQQKGKYARAMVQWRCIFVFAVFFYAGSLLEHFLSAILPAITINF